MVIEIKLLGPFEAIANDVSIMQTAVKPRQMLATLALSPGSVVPVSALIVEVWGHLPPRSATATLHTYIGKLRKELERALGKGSADQVKKILATEQIGYRLNVLRRTWTRVATSNSPGGDGRQPSMATISPRHRR